MPSFVLDHEQICDLVPRLCETVVHFFESSALHRLPDRIAFFLRPDCGAVYVNLVGPKLIREIGSITLPTFESQYYEIETSNVDGNFETKHNTILQSMRDVIRRELLRLPLQATLIPILSRHSLHITTIAYDDMETEKQIELESA